MNSRTVAGLIVLLVALPVTAQVVADTAVFPIVASLQGVGDSVWVSDLTVHSLSASEMELGLQFFPENQSNTINIFFPNRITLGARETRTIVDLVGTFFEMDDIKGMVVVTCAQDFIPSNPEDCAFLGTTRTYNVGSPDGTFGQTVPWIDTLFNPGLSISVVTGAFNDADFRSNLGIANVSLFSDVEVHYRFLTSGTKVEVEGSRTIPQASVRQWSFAQLGVGMVEGPITVELWLDPEDATPDPCEAESPNLFIGYVSKVDGNPDGTDDAEFLYAVPVEEYDCE